MATAYQPHNRRTPKPGEKSIRDEAQYLHTASQCHSSKHLYAYYVEKVVRGALYVRQKASGVQTGWQGGAAYALKDKATNTGGAA